MIEATLVCNFLPEVIPRLESRVGESLSGSGGHLCVMNARVRDRECGLAITIVDGVHGAVSARNAGCVETIISSGYKIGGNYTQWWRRDCLMYQDAP